MRAARASMLLSALTLAAAMLLAACDSGHPGRTTVQTVTIPATVTSTSAATSASTTLGTTTTSAAAVVSTGTIPKTLAAGLRPIGKSRRFHPRVLGKPTLRCAKAPGRFEAHIELFAENKVVLIAAGVGHAGKCYGSVVTLDPTGVIHFRRGATVKQLFRAWGEPLNAHRMASFKGTVRYYLAGKRVKHLPKLTEHAEIVLEVGPYVPPHKTFTFAAG